MADIGSDEGGTTGPKLPPDVDGTLLPVDGVVDGRSGAGGGGGPLGVGCLFGVTWTPD